MNREEWVLGLGGSSHDFAAALMRDTDIIVAVEEERVSRRKHGFAWWYQNPVGRSVQYCLDAAGIRLEDVSRIVSSDLLPYKARHDFAVPMTLYPHHLCHAASAFMMLPSAARAAILVYDGMGSIRTTRGGSLPLNTRETFSFFRSAEGRLECLGTTFGESVFEHDGYPSGCTNSIGMVYEMVTAMLDFDLYDSGKTMGLAAHGRPRYVDEFRRFATFGTTPDQCFSFDPTHPEFVALIQDALIAERHGFAVKADLAASVQALLDETLLSCIALFGTEGYDAIALAGGCALNTVANSALASRLPGAVRLLVPPHASDAGLCMGALWLDAHERQSGPFSLTFNGGPLDPAISRPGRTYEAWECEEAVRAFYPRLAHDSAGSTPAGLAKILAEGEIVGVFSGRSEIGPRALGGRSILADPRRAMVRERINRELKGREPFRPLAPMVLAHRFDDYFVDPRQADRFMLRVARATDRCRQDAPAVVHVDGTARVQVVDEQTDPFLKALLEAFESETGIPILLNTSFNRRGEPIVETPLDAVDAFVGMGLDALYLDGALYRVAGA